MSLLQDFLAHVPHPDLDGAEVPPPPIPSMDELIAESSIGEYGTITCELEPFRSVGRLGRLTTWPANKAGVQRSCSVKCSMHVACQAVKARRLLTDEVAIKWMLLGVVPEADATKDRKRELGVLHKAEFSKLFEAA